MRVANIATENVSEEGDEAELTRYGGFDAATLSETNLPSDKGLQQMSRCLSWLLRHGARSENLSITDEGYVTVDDVLQWMRTCTKRHIRGRNIPVCWWTENNIRRLVLQDAKRRYRLTTQGSAAVLMIRAEQGHSIQLNDFVMLKPIKINQCERLYPKTVVHGTSHQSWERIQKCGYIFAGCRQHIHFAQAASAAAGIRRTATVLLHIDLLAAVTAGYLFFESGNNVILCSGHPVLSSCTDEVEAEETSCSMLDASAENGGCGSRPPVTQTDKKLPVSFITRVEYTQLGHT